MEAILRDEMLTNWPYSPLPRPCEAFHTPHPRSPGPRNEGCIQPEDSMDKCDSGHLLGDEPDATLRHCVFR